MSHVAVSAERQILNLLHRYAECVDDGDFDGVSALFEHAEFHVAGAAGQRGAALGEVMRSTVATYDGSPRTKHVTTDAIVEIDAVTAWCRSYFTVFQATPTLTLQPTSPAATTIASSASTAHGASRIGRSSSSTSATSPSTSGRGRYSGAGTASATMRHPKSNCSTSFATGVECR